MIMAKVLMLMISLPGLACGLLGARLAPRHSRAFSKLHASNRDDFFSKKDPEVVAQLNKLVFSPEEAASYGVEGEMGGSDVDVIYNCPLWRVSWASLPGVREGYHVHMPIFTTMFERLISAPRPWLFVQLYIPGGVKNSWEPENALTPTQAARPPARPFNQG